MTARRTILVDLRAAQFNGDRGIPAYAQSLAVELARGHGRHRWLFWHDPRRPLPTRAAELAAHGEWRSTPELAADTATRIDAVLSGCFFLPDHRCDGESLLPDWLRQRQPRRLGIVYDLVPLLFPDRYLARPRSRRHYHECLRVMRRSDQLFAISRATRRDVIRHAAVDPARVHCIYGDIDHAKRALMARPAATTAAVPARHGLRGRYLACVGGDDWRKNMDAAVAAFADYRRDQPDYQLAIICKLSAPRIAQLEAVAAAAGLPAGAVVCTGYVSDEDLVALVAHAEMLVYPSRYEGLGLPVLESYGCGTPAVGSDTSSVAELVIPELACDPEDPAAIAAAMRRLTADPALAEASLAFGRRRLAEELGWERAAAAVIEQIEDRPRTWTFFVPPRPRVAVVAALPPARTGIAPYTLRYLQSDAWQTTFFEAAPGPRPASQGGLLPGNRVAPAETFPAAALRDRHDAAVFVLGNSAHHVKVLDALMRSRGSRPRRLAYLHEAALESLFRAWLGPAVERLPAPPSTVGQQPAWIAEALAAKPALARCLRLLAEQGELDGLIVNSAACRDLVRAALGSLADRWTIDVAFNPLPDIPAAHQPPSAADDSLTIGSFGLAGDTKRLDLVVQAAGRIAAARPVRLVIAGWEAARFCRRLQPPRGIDLEVIDSPDEATLLATMHGVDVAVQLRWPTFGESSGVINDLLALGVPLVTTAAGSFAELPAEAASFVPPGCSAADLAAAIEAAAARPSATERLADLAAARSPTAFARRFAEILATTPGRWIEPVDPAGLPPAVRTRIDVTLACRDCDAVPKVPQAGRIREVDGRAVQIMHDGTLVEADCYYANWLTRIMADLDGHHEPQEELIFHHLLRHARPGTLFVELGAYWAYYTAWYLRAVPGSRGVCIEPEAANLEVGRRNLGLNGKRARMIRARVGERHEPSRGDETPECLDMPAIEARLGGQPIEVLHLDVQGAEAGFLRSLRRSGAANLVRFVVVSTHHESISGSATTHEECLAELESQGAVILVEHSVAESFSGDGLIVASFDAGDRGLPLPSISRADPAFSGRIWEPAA